jgi:alpha-beta hydrolase superfamily lysophospholipase
VGGDNDTWLALKDALARPVRERDLPEVAGHDPPAIALVRAALHGTMLRNDIYDFCPHRHLPRTRRQHRPHPRREILRAAALGDVRSRLVARQRAVGDDPALGLGQRAYRWLNRATSAPWASPIS